MNGEADNARMYVYTCMHLAFEELKLDHIIRITVFPIYGGLNKTLHRRQFIYYILKQDLLVGIG